MFGFFLPIAAISMIEIKENWQHFPAKLNRGGGWGEKQTKPFPSPIISKYNESLKDLCFFIKISVTSSNAWQDVFILLRTWGAGSPEDRPNASMRTNAADKNAQYYFNPFDTEENWPVITHSLQKDLFCNILFAKQLFKRNQLWHLCIFHNFAQ